MEMAFKFNHPETSAAAGARPERFQAARNHERRATMILDAECRVAFDQFREERLLWDSLAGA